MKTCVFCEKPLSEGKSVEHIIPIWLLKALCIEKEIITPTHFSSTTKKAVSTRKQDIHSLVSGGICASCNNGWMSALEENVKDNLLSLIENKKVVIDLNEADRFELSRWALKTALVLNLGSNFHKNIPEAHYTSIFQNPSTLPENVIVLAQQHHYTRPFYWMQQSGWFFNEKGPPKDEKTLSEIADSNYKISFQFKYLILVVAFNPNPDYLFTIWKGIHVPLYPMRGQVACYEKEQFSWNDSEKALIEFHLGLELSSKQVVQQSTVAGP